MFTRAFVCCAKLLTPVLVCALAAAAPLGTAFTYQGRLENGGLAVNGNVDLRFQIFPQAVGGAASTGFVTLNNVAATDGLFTVSIDFGESVFNGEDRFLQVEAAVPSGSAFVAVNPRQRLAATPYALQTRGIFVDNLLNVGIGTTATSARLTVNPDLGVTAGGSFGVYLRGDLGGFGGALFTRSEEGDNQCQIEPDFDGAGTFVIWTRSEFGNGLTFDGNTTGSSNPTLTLSSTVAPVQFNTNNSGNGSVALPSNAISAAEIFDEPGVANESTGVTGILVGTTMTNIASRTITVPAAGFVLALAQADMSYGHVTGTKTNVEYGVSADPSTLPTNQDVQTALTSAYPTGTCDFGATAHGLFDVAAGANTFYFNARKISGGGSISMFDVQLTLVYFPTAYGAVVSNLTAGDRIPSQDAAHTRPGLTPDELAGEQAASAAFHQHRTEAEFAAMRAEMAAMQQRLDEVVAQQRALRPASAGNTPSD